MAFGIVCEYNPFHNGHLLQINEIKKSTDEPIICVMSGNFTQRGEIAIADKYARAKAALECGADLVVELPIPFCISSAEYFARAGVFIAESAGADSLYFGSECGDAQLILSAAKAIYSDEVQQKIADEIKTGITFICNYGVIFHEILLLKKAIEMTKFYIIIPFKKYVSQYII